MRPSRDHHLPPDPDAYRHAAHPKGRIVVIAPTRAACETIELALGLHLDTLLEREHGQEIRDLAASGRDSGSWRAPGPARRSAIRPIAESILAGAASGRRGEPGAGGDARDPDLERGDRHHRHRPALVPGRPHHRPGYRDRGRDPPDLGRAGAVPGAGEARRVPLRLAQRHGGSDLLRALPRERRGARDACLRSRRSRRKVQVLPQTARRVPQRALHPPRDQGAARGGRVPAHPRRGRAPGRGAGRAVEAAHDRVLPRRRADPGDPPVSRGRGRAARSSSR